MRAAYYRHGRVATTEDFEVVREVLQDPATVVWVDLPVVSDDATLLFLSRDLAIHPLVVEDLYAQALLPKVEDFDDYLYVLLHAIRREGGAGQGDLAISEIDLLLSERWLITHSLDPLTIDKVFAEALRQRKLWDRGAAWIFHAVIDRVVDEYLPVTEAFDEDLEAIETDVLDASADNRTMERLFAVKRSLVKLRRLTVHQREIFMRLSRREFSVIPESLLPFMRDVYDHFARNMDLSEGYRDLASSVLEMHLSMQSHRLNEVVKLLTMLSTVMLPLTLIAGVYGMNFEHMPELKWKYGYPFALGMMAAVGMLMVLYFRRKKWL